MRLAMVGSLRFAPGMWLAREKLGMQVVSFPGTFE
jgi:hypothetical protein